MTCPRLVLPATLTLALLAPACGLIGIEPDEIDIADDGVDDAAGGTEESDTEESGTTGTTDGGESTGDSTTGATTTGDTTSDTTSDTSDASGDTGTSDSQEGTDGVTPDCGEFVTIDLLLESNPVEVPDGPSSFAGSCGTAGPEVVGAFMAPAAGDYEFTLEPADFDGVLYLVRALDCDPQAFADESCGGPGTPQVATLAEFEIVYVFVDANVGPVSGSVVISAL